ncbi:MAG: S-layer homology domain-containing protein, partial [Cyanobacteria bacterium Co-bin13]|nr:S-layer homology domain-containing protein [Cyanobacteria bacterium Co-bin13]
MALTGSAAIASSQPEKPSGPIQDFDWLYDQSLLKDDDDDDDDDDREGGSVQIQQNRTTTTTTVTQTRYTDLVANYWASDFIYRLSSIQVVRGFPSGAFLPSNNLTQAQFAAMVARAFDRPAVRQTVTIRNLSSSYWAYRSI